MPRSALIFSDEGELGVRIADDKSQARFMPVKIVDDQRPVGLGDRHRQVGPRHRRRPGLRQGRRPGRGGRRRPRPTCRSGAAGMRRIVDYAISHARLTLSILVFLLLAGIVAYSTIPKEASPDVTDPDHLRPAVAARHLAGGRRAAAGPADGDAAQDGRQRQGDAVGGLRGRRLRAPRVRGRASTPTSRSRTCAPRSTTPSPTCRPTPTSRACSRSISASSR